MTQISSFFDANMVNGVPDREYDATSWANYFKGLIGNGVSITPSSNLQVVAGTGLNVILSPGIAYINGYYYNNTEPLTVPINIANATYPRITSIVIELNLKNREIICQTVDGSAQSSPTAPQITQTESTYQLQLATVYVPAGATAIGTITDTRENTEVCGYMQMLAPTIPPAFLANLTLQGTIKNDATIIGGTYKNSCVEDTGINSCGISNSTLSGTIVNEGTISGGTLLSTLISNSTINQPTINGGGISSCGISDSTLSGSIVNKGRISGGTLLSTLISNSTINQPTINGGGIENVLINNATFEGKIEINTSIGKQSLIDYYSGTHTQLVAPNVTGQCTISWWLIKAPLLSGPSLNGSIGVLTMSITLDSTYNWSNNNRQQIDISSLPVSSARTITPTPYFQVGTSQGVLWLAGSNLTLEAGKTYTTKALMWQ